MFRHKSRVIKGQTSNKRYFIFSHESKYTVYCCKLLSPKKDEIKNAIDDNVCVFQVLTEGAVTKSNIVQAEEKGEANNHHHKEEEEGTVEKEVGFY